KTELLRRLMFLREKIAAASENFNVKQLDLQAGRLLRGDLTRDAFEFFQDHTLGKHFRKNDGLFVFRGIKHVQWNPRATKLLQQLCDHGIAVGPIRFQFHNRVALKCLSHILGLEHACFIELAGKTPCGGEIDKNSAALFKFGLQAFRRERLPVTVDLRICGSNCRRLKFVADEIHTTPKHEQEQEHEHDGPLHSCRCWNNEGAFHPAGNTDNKQEAARPNRSCQAALCAEYVKEK